MGKSRSRRGGVPIAIDRAVFLWVNGLAVHAAALNGLMRILAQDSPYLLALFYVALWFALPREDASTRRALVVSVGAAAVGIVVAVLIGAVWDRPRPFVVLGAQDHLLVAHAADASFPSDHATLFFAAAFTLLRQRGWVGWATLAAGVAVAVARVWVGVHWPSDVVGGAALGLLASLAVWPARAPLEALADWGMRVTGVMPRGRVRRRLAP